MSFQREGRGGGGGGKDDMPTRREDVNQIFVGRLPDSVTEDDLTQYFTQFGTVSDLNLLKDNKGKSKGCAFMKLDSAEEVDKLMAKRPHSLKDAELELRRSAPGDLPEDTVLTLQMHVGRLRSNHTEEILREYFTQFGTITELRRPKFGDTGTLRNFAFIKFEDHDSVDKIVLPRVHTIDGVDVPVRKYLDEKDKERVERLYMRKRGKGGGGPMGGRGAGGGGRGRGWSTEGPYPGGGFGNRFGASGRFGRDGYGPGGGALGGGYFGGGGRGGFGGGGAAGYGAGGAYGYGGSGGSGAFGGSGFGGGGAGGYANSTPGMGGMGGGGGGAGASPWNANVNAWSDFRTALLQAKVTPEAVKILEQQNLMDHQFLSSLPRHNFEELPISVGDRLRVQQLLRSMYS